MKFISWNVNGLRACVQKGFGDFFREVDADIVALQETKMQAGQFGNPWELIFPAVFIAMIPIIVLFLCLQKHIVRGVADGAVKG